MIFHLTLAHGDHDAVPECTLLSRSKMSPWSLLRAPDWWMCPSACSSEIKLPNPKDLIVVRGWVDTVSLAVTPTLLFWNRVSWSEAPHSRTAMSGHCILDYATSLCCSEIELPDEKSLIVVQRWVDTASLTVPRTLLFWNRVALNENYHCDRLVDTAFLTVSLTLSHRVCEGHRCTAMSGHYLRDCAPDSVGLKSSCLMRRVSWRWWTLPSWLCPRLCVLKSSSLMRRISSCTAMWTLRLLDSLCCSEIELPDEKSLIVCTAIGGHCLLDCVTHSVVLK